MKQVLLDYLPGYMFDGSKVVSTGAALPSSQFINRETGELMYYVRPLFQDGPAVGLFIRHDGVVSALEKRKSEG
jgi:hypothetical protein